MDVRFHNGGSEAVVHAEVADTDAERARGLMERTSIPIDRGMLFVWSEAAPRTFYMFNTPIPLDVIAIRAGRVAGVYGMVPCREALPAACPRTDIGRADAALEVNAGTAARLGIVVGSAVESAALATV